MKDQEFEVKEYALVSIDAMMGQLSGRLPLVNKEVSE